VLTIKQRSSYGGLAPGPTLPILPHENLMDRYANLEQSLDVRSCAVYLCTVIRSVVARGAACHAFNYAFLYLFFFMCLARLVCDVHMLLNQ
jgi:hypothetical protein